MEEEKRETEKDQAVDVDSDGKIISICNSKI